MTPSHAQIVDPISKGRRQALWMQTAEHIRSEIASGELGESGRLPSERELSDTLGVSRVTVRKALAHLVEGGHIQSSHGRGWYVERAQQKKEYPHRLESFTETAQRKGLTVTSVVLVCESVPATLDEADELLIAPGTGLFHLRRIRLLDGLPVVVDDSRVPMELLPESVLSADFSTESLYKLLIDVGHEPAEAASTIEARKADADVAGPLGLELGEPVLHVGEQVVDTSGRFVLLSNLHYRGDRYRMRTSFLRIPIESTQ